MAGGVMARIGRWCFRRRWWVLAAWLAAVVVGAMASGPVVDALADNNQPKNMESVRAYDVLNTGAHPAGQPGGAPRHEPGRAVLAADHPAGTGIRVRRPGGGKPAGAGRRGLGVGHVRRTPGVFQDHRPGLERPDRGDPARPGPVHRLR